MHTLLSYQKNISITFPLQKTAANISSNTNCSVTKPQETNEKIYTKNTHNNIESSEVAKSNVIVTILNAVPFDDLISTMLCYSGT